MKTSSIYRKLFPGLVLLIAVSFASCKKNNVDPAGQFRLKVVNASPTSGPQTFTLTGNVLVSNGLNYMDATDYITTPSGTRLVAEFKNMGTNSVFASGEIWTDNDNSQTVYLAGQGSKARVKVFKDNLDSPNNGQVKIKFIYFSDNGPSVINIRNGSGAELVNLLRHDEDSGYKFVAPGTITVRISNVTNDDSFTTFNIRDLQAGKIYSLYFTDDANGNMVVNKVIHN